MDSSSSSLIAVIVLALLATESSAKCDSDTCAPVVSKCLLTDACECNIKTNVIELSASNFNCSCCRSCSKCLGEKLFECCECVNLCKPKDDHKLSRTSTVEDLIEPIPALFSALTEEEDTHLRWTSLSYPVHQDMFMFQPPGIENPTFAATDGQTNTMDQSMFVPAIDKNCTVAFMSDCLSLGKCKSSCKSMGAGRFRWFHEHGCCQCVGSECLDYGKSRAQCIRCPVIDNAIKKEPVVNKIEKVPHKETKKDNKKTDKKDHSNKRKDEKKVTKSDSAGKKKKTSHH